MTTFALIFLLARAFSSGCAALTGVEAISNGVPAFRKPKSKNAATTLLLLGADRDHDDAERHRAGQADGPAATSTPHDLDRLTPRRRAAAGRLRPAHGDRPDRPRRSSTTSRPASTSSSPMTGVILVLAANTAFNGFPVLGSILAQDGYAPARAGLARRPAGLQQRHRLPGGDGDRPDPGLRRRVDPADPALHRRRLRVVQPQPARHDPALDPAPEDRDATPPCGAGCIRSRVINAFGLAFTAVVLVIVLVTKFLAGAWIAILAMIVFFMLMRGIRRHYDNVERGARRRRGRQGAARPGCTRSCWSPSCTSRRCGRSPSPRRPGPTCSRRVYVAVDADGDQPAARGVGRAQHRRAAQGAALAVPRADPADRRVRHARSGKANPRGVVAVYIPEYVVGRWWEQLLHNQTALRLKGRLLFTPGVMVTSVPYQLRSSAVAARARGARGRLGAARPTLRRGQRRRPGRRPTGRSRDEPATRQPPTPAAKQPRGASRVGERFEAVVGPVAHGGHCVVRLDPTGGPGGLRPARDARRAGRRSRSPRAPTATGSGAATRSRCSSRRRTGSPPPCPYAGPGCCGGCDFQHVDAAGASAR